MRRMSAAIQLFGLPCPEKRPWTITKSPSATINPGSYFSVDGTLLIRLKRPSRLKYEPGLIVAEGDYQPRLIFQRRRNTLDQIEETIAARLDMSAVLDVAGRPVALSR